ncbi:MAG: hypothetical protein LBK01_04775 [Burkholderiaceae bacterium]|nr:hypothetical protein [Burkholderiaceae bacterium]
MRGDEPVKQAAESVLEDMGIPVPYDAVHFRTKGNRIVFTLHIMDEIGYEIVMQETQVEYELDDALVADLKEAGYAEETEYALAE